MTPAPDELFARALRRRDPLRADGATDALRLLDGAGDGAVFDGLFIDDFAGRWLASVQNPALVERWRSLLLAAAAGNLKFQISNLKSVCLKSVYWKVLDSKDKAGPQHLAGERVEAPFIVRENGVSYRIDFQAGYSQGIFLDQRDNRLAVRRLAAEAVGKNVSAVAVAAADGAAVLNCFAYTCAFSVAAAAGGATTASVDLSKHYLDWGRENFRLNGLDPASGHEFFAGDAFDWLRRFGRRGRRFAGIVLDPPTFSRNRDGKIFRVELDFGRLVELAAPLLAPGGWLLCCANQRSLPVAGFRRMIADALSSGLAWKLETAPMPPDFTGESYLRVIWAWRR